MSINNKVAYICGNKLRHACDRLPSLQKRATMVHDLISSYGLFQHPKLAVVKSTSATENDLRTFHSDNYIDFMKRINNLNDFSVVDDEQTQFGLGYDCPILEKNFDLMKTIAGSSLSAAKILGDNKCTVAVNWFGGWHHAQKDGAEGFCYVNDVVIAIEYLLTKFNKILFLDLDIHHGNGVQNAFENSKKVMTVSLHKMEPGFYPGTGNVSDIGSEDGEYYTINVPFLDGVSDISYKKVFDAIFPKIISAFQPECIVVQCGADGLIGDPVGEANLTLESIGHCVKKIKGLKLPTLYLGGGGYNFSNTARLWAYLTSIILGCRLFNDIPDRSKFFPIYVPSYELHIDPGRLKDKNTDAYTDFLIKTIIKNCEKIA